MLQRLRYFFYLAWNWSPWLAAFVTWHEWRGEKALGISTTGIDELKDLEEDGVDISHASMYMPMNFFILDWLLENNGDAAKKEGFIDLGCGKGRVLIAAAAHGYTNIMGLDFHPRLCAIAIQNTASVSLRFPDATFRIINNDAFYFDIPETVSTIFLFNPFDTVIMSGVVQRIVASQTRKARTIRILYANPMDKGLFLNEGFKEIRYIKKLGYLEASILERI
jgi:predicted RNA methylase